MRVIDADMYFIPEELFTDEALLERFLGEVPAQDGWFARCEEIPGTDGRRQIIVEKPKGAPNLNYAQYDYILEQQLKDLDEAGADAGLLKIPCAQEWMSLEMCRYFNDKMYEHAQKSGGRLIPLAVVPPYGTPENIAELKRCVNELGMKSVQLSCHYRDAYLDDERFASFFEVLNEMEMTAYIHHTPVPVEYKTFADYNLVRRFYGRLVDQGLAIARELYSGFFTKYPKVKFVHSMLGGGFFAIMNVMMPQKPKNESVNRFAGGNDDVREQFKNNIYFEMSPAQSWGKLQLEFAVKAVGADHIVFGSSYPVRKEWLTDGIPFVKSLDISEEEKALILGGNAERLYLQ